MIYVTGDMHGDESRLYDSQWRKLKSGDILIVCGDFGYLWDGGKKEKSVIEYLGSRKFTVCFVDGTHENFSKINKCHETIWKGGHVHRISGNLFHLMRGQIFNIDGVKVFTFGGGAKVTKKKAGVEAPLTENSKNAPATAREYMNSVNISEEGSIDINKFALTFKNLENADSFKEKIFQKTGIKPEIIISGD